MWVAVLCAVAAVATGSAVRLHACEGLTHAGDLYNAAPQEVELFAVIKGALQYEGDFDVHFLEFPILCDIANYLSITVCPPLTFVSLAALESVGKNLDIVSNEALTLVQFTSLKQVGGKLNIFDSNTLRATVFPQLAYVGGNLAFEANPVLTYIDMTALTYVQGSIGIYGCGSLTAASFPQVTWLYSIGLVDDARLAALDFHSLQRMDVFGINLASTALTTFTFEALTYIQGSVSVRLNSFLTSIVFPVLTSFCGVNLSGPGELAIYNNTALAQLAVPSLREFPGYSSFMCYNAPIFTVPPQLPAVWQGKKCRVANGTSCPSDYSPCS